MQFKVVRQTDITAIETMRESELRLELTNWNEKYKELEEKRNVVQSAYKLIQDIEQGETVNTSLDIFERSTEQKEKC